MAKIMVGIPIHRPMEFKVFESFIRLANHRGKHEYNFVMIQNSLVYDAREFIADEFMKSDCEALAMIDSDMTFHHETLEILYNHNKPFLTAMAFKRVAPYQPCFFTKNGINENGEPFLEVPMEWSQGLLPIEGSGLACVLIRREAFEKLQKPYFFPMENMGEDLSFCLRLKNAGVPMYCDTRIQAGHLATIEIMESHFRSLYEHSKAKVDKK